eukprot:8700415-Pyramimonas_sp.AAC.1
MSNGDATPMPAGKVARAAVCNAAQSSPVKYQPRHPHSGNPTGRGSQVRIGTPFRTFGTVDHPLVSLQATCTIRQLSYPPGRTN